MAGDKAVVITSLVVISGYISAEQEELKIKKAQSIVEPPFISSDQEPQGVSLADHSGSLINN